MDQNMKLQKLNEVLKRCKNAPFYKERLPDKHLETLDELKNIPLTTKDDVRENSPSGFICVPKEELFQYHESFGTTGTPASVWLTRDDFYDLAQSVNEGGINFNSSDVVLVRFPYAISGVAHFVHAAAQMKDACVIPASSRSFVSPYTRIVNLLKKLDVTVLAGLPLQAVLIAETAEIMGYHPRKDFPSLRVLYTAGELMTPQKRQLLEDIWGVPVSDNYGLTELGAVAVNCKYGTHHMFEDRFIFEILDENLEKEVNKGDVGNLVITTLKRQGSPIIRYLTGDRARIKAIECPCGRHETIEVRGRAQDVIKIGSKSFDLWDLNEIISYLPFRRFWAAGPSDGSLKIVLEQEKPEDAVTPELIHSIEDMYEIALSVDVVKKGILYDRNKLLLVNTVGKPKNIYTGKEMLEKAYLDTPWD